MSDTSSGSRCVRRSRCSCSRCSARRRNVYAAAISAPSVRPTYPPRISDRSAIRVPGSRRSGSVRPCTSCRSCTANSTSRSPPAPSFSSRSRWLSGMFRSTRRRIACTSSTKESRPDGAPHAGRGDLDELPADLGVARRRAGLEQRLELPGLRPPLVVGGVAGRRPHQRAGLALGAQRRVDLPGGAVADPHHPGGQLRRRGEHPRLVGLSGARAVLRRRVVGGEDDVDVGDVVELLGAALAHGDHRQPGRRRGRRQLGGGHREPRLQRRVGQLGQRLADGRQRRRRQARLDRRREVVGGDDQQLRPVGAAQRGDRRAAGHRRPARRRSRCTAAPPGRRPPTRPAPCASSAARSAPPPALPAAAGASRPGWWRGDRPARSTRRARRSAGRGTAARRAAAAISSSPSSAASASLASPFSASSGRPAREIAASTSCASPVGPASVNSPDRRQVGADPVRVREPVPGRGADGRPGHRA